MQMEHIFLTNTYEFFTLSFNIVKLIYFNRIFKSESLIELEMFQKDWTISRYNIVKFQGQK